MTRVALLWHMHQPFYQDLATGEHILPWVRLHALKDYWGMVALMREFPSVRVTFNLVPSLLVQLEAFARDEAKDRHLELGLKPAEHLTADERRYCAEHFFHAQRERMIAPYPRYAELLARREEGRRGGATSALTTGELRDLQVWHKLTWIDPYYLDADERIRALVRKDRGFTEHDKAVLREVELEILRRVVPEYREASERGQVELSTSPFYHPILPLLCDSQVHLELHPGAGTPRQPFRYPQDALEQLERSVALHERLFGSRPAGLWPSEGSVSEAMLPLVARAGFRWLATDEDILARSASVRFTRTPAGHLEQPEALYRPYRLNHDLACGFRDHALSDRIGFAYSSWSPEAAADDFVHRLVEAGNRHRARTGRDATVFVILDGENAWEHYAGQGRPFLRALYGRLASHSDLASVTMSEACSSADAVLSPISAGSWINGDFYIWIGHPDDHRAWSQLGDARRALESPGPAVSAAALAQAREEVLIAEGSDWCWWYGDDHSSDHDSEFDELFRRHLRNVYRALDRPVPEELFATNITTAPQAVRVHTPSGFISPVIDGQPGSYFEWLGSGGVDLKAIAGAMHQISRDEGHVSAIRFGFDDRHLFLRLDGQGACEAGRQITIRFLKPGGVQVVLGHTVAPRIEIRTQDAGAWEPIAAKGLLGAVREIVEVQVPLDALRLQSGDHVAFIVTLTKGEETTHYPGQGAIEFHVPSTNPGATNWSA